MLPDECLERNRRLAWARYFAAREDARQMAWWAAEIGAWLTAEVEHVPAPALELLALVRDALPAGGALAVDRYVAHLRQTDAVA